MSQRHKVPTSPFGGRYTDILRRLGQVVHTYGPRGMCSFLSETGAGGHRVNTITRGFLSSPDCSLSKEERDTDNPVPSQGKGTQRSLAGQAATQHSKEVRTINNSSSPGRRRIGPQAGDTGQGIPAWRCGPLDHVVYVLRIWSLIAEWSAGDSFDLSQDGELAGRRPTWAADGLAGRKWERIVRTLRPARLMILFLRCFSFASERWNFVHLVCIDCISLPVASWWL